MNMTLSVSNAKGLTTAAPRDSHLLKPNPLSSLSSLHSLQVYVISSFIDFPYCLLNWYCLL